MPMDRKSSWSAMLFKRRLCVVPKADYQIIDTWDAMGMQATGSKDVAASEVLGTVTSAEGRPAVKLSDNPMKAMGAPAELARYRRVFQLGEQAPLPVAV